MNKEDLKKYPIKDILNILIDIGNKTGDNDILVQCGFYSDAERSESLENDFYKNLFYSWVVKVIEINKCEFEKRIRSKKIKKINQNLHRKD